MSHRRPRFRTVLLVIVALAVGASASAYATGAIQSAKEPVVRESLAAANNPTGGKGRTLGLSRVTVQPGATISLHHHAGTQIAHIDQGVLTYSVVTGHVDVMTGAADDNPQRVRRIRAGQTGPLRAGEWIVEQPNMHHHVVNKGKRTVVIYLASLFPIGSPPSIPLDQ